MPNCKCKQYNRRDDAKAEEYRIKSLQEMRRKQDEENARRLERFRRKKEIEKLERLKREQERQMITIDWCDVSVRLG